MGHTGRAARALAIRDHLLPLIRAHGFVLEAGGGSLRIVMWRAGRFRFALRGPPITPWPGTSPPGSYAAALARQRADPVPPWGLDVWHDRKVLSLRWDDAGRAEVISFNRGRWEAEALTIGAADPPRGA
jgi:hypothetical protein